MATTAVTAFNPVSRPAFAVAEADVSALAKALAGTTSFGKRISIKGGVFRLVVDGQEVAAIEERFLDVVIVNAQSSVGRSYYEGTYVDGQATAPVCWSADGKLPDAGSKKPQARSCDTCPQNVKGSGNNESRACRFLQRLAVVAAADLEKGDVMQLSVPSRSLFGKEEKGNFPLQAYARYFVANKASPDMVVTRLRFDTTSESPKLFFKPMRWLTDEEYGWVREKRNSEDALNAITMHASTLDTMGQAFETEEPPPAPAKPAAARPVAPAAKPAPVVEDEEPPPPAPKAAKPAARVVEAEVEDVPAPTVRRAAEAKPAASLEKVLNDWPDDEA